MVAAVNGGHQNGGADINAAGQPDTPMEVLTDLLGKALRCDDPAAAKQLVHQAHGIAAGLDPYLAEISTPPSEVCAGWLTIKLSWPGTERYKCLEYHQNLIRFLLKHCRCATTSWQHLCLMIGRALMPR